MTLSQWLIYILGGRLVIYLWQQFPLPTFLEEKKTIKKLHQCDLCSGVWIFTALAYFMGADLLGALGFHYILLVSEFLTGGVISFLTHIFIIGWQDKFAPEIVL